MPRLSKAAEQERRDKIVHVAENLFVKNGYENTTINQIVDDMGLAKGTFYYHFRAKEELLVAVSNRLIAETSDKLAQVHVQKDKDIIWRIKNIIKTYHDDFYRNKSIWRHIYHPRNVALHAQVARISAKRFTPILKELLTEAVEAGKIDGPQANEMAETLLALFDLFSRQLCTKSEHEQRIRLFDTLRHLIKVILGENCIPEFEH